LFIRSECEGSVWLRQERSFAFAQDDNRIMTSLAASIAALHEKIARACAENGRDPHEVDLVAVSKLQPPERITDALAAGQRLFGENRVQEAKARWAGLRAQYPGLKLHLIGPLQTNKARDAVALFDCIETVDRPALADDLAKEMKKQGRPLPCFIQVNTGGKNRRAASTPPVCPAFSIIAARPVSLYAA